LVVASAHFGWGVFFSYGFDERAWYSEIHMVTQSVYGA
jgi:hypothetical protein